MAKSLIIFGFIIVVLAIMGTFPIVAIAVFGIVIVGLFLIFGNRSQ